MLHHAIVFLVVVLTTAVLGFGGIAAGATSIAKILFVVFLIMAVVSFIFGCRRRQELVRCMTSHHSNHPTMRKFYE